VGLLYKDVMGVRKQLLSCAVYMRNRRFIGIEVVVSLTLNPKSKQLPRNEWDNKSKRKEHNHGKKKD
jgi:hypothetical protein